MHSERSAKSSQSTDLAQFQRVLVIYRPHQTATESANSHLLTSPPCKSQSQRTIYEHGRSQQTAHSTSPAAREQSSSRRFALLCGHLVGRHPGRGRDRHSRVRRQSSSARSRHHTIRQRSQFRCGGHRIVGAVVQPPNGTVVLMEDWFKTSVGPTKKAQTNASISSQNTAIARCYVAATADLMESVAHGHDLVACPWFICPSDAVFIGARWASVRTGASCYRKSTNLFEKMKNEQMLKMNKC